MKIDAYKVNNWWWLCPKAVARARNSEEEVVIVAHTEEVTSFDRSDIFCVIANLAARWAQQRLVSFRSNLLMAILYAALALVAIWPPVRGLARGIPSYVALGIVAVGAGSRLVSCLLAAKSKLKAGKFAPSLLQGSKQMLPPLQAHNKRIPSRGFPFRRTGIILLMVIVAILLNSVVIASPSRPAVIGTRIVFGPELVIPGTSWTSQQVWTSNTIHVAFADGGEDTIWAVKVEYTLKQTDLLQTPEDWDNWMITSMGAVIGRMTKYVWEQNLDPAYTTEQKIADLVASVEETTQDLEEYIADQFGEVADGVVLWTIDVELVKLGLSEYATIYKAQNK